MGGILRSNGKIRRPKVEKEPMEVPTKYFKFTTIYAVLKERIIRGILLFQFVMTVAVLLRFSRKFRISCLQFH